MRVLFRMLAALRRSLMLLALLGALALNVATVTSGAVFTAVSGAVAAVSGASTVLARQKAARAGEKALVKRTSRRVTARLARAGARNAAGSFAEAIPLAGIAVTAAALAWDLRDACATAADLAVLEGQLDDPGADPEALRSGFDCRSLLKGAEAGREREAGVED